MFSTGFSTLLGLEIYYPGFFFNLGLSTLALFKLYAALLAATTTSYLDDNFEAYYSLVAEALDFERSFNKDFIVSISEL